MENEKVPRDQRIDQIGFAAELQKHYADDLKTAVKMRMAENATPRAEGDFFEALLIADQTRKSIDAAKIFKLLEQQKITKKQLLSAITIKLDAAREFLSREQLDKLCDQTPASPTLRVTRKHGVELKLVDALAGLSAGLAPQQ